MRPKPLWLSALAALVLLASCGNGNGNTTPDGVGDAGNADLSKQPDPDVPVIQDIVVSPETTPWGDADGGPNGDDGELPDGYLPDGLNECLKDSDCEGKTLALTPCQRPMCDKHQGVCVAGPRAPGEPCDDGDACTAAAVSTAEGACLGEIVVCDDGNICTTDVCKPGEGCIQIHNDNVCDDGNACTKSDRCQLGSCSGDKTDKCGCDDDEDCADFDDDDLCNGQVKCVFGECKVPNSTVKECTDTEKKPCKKVICLPETGECVKSLRENGRPCDDADACTIGDLCLNGDCVGSAPKNCDDGNPCTNDTCDQEFGCKAEYSQYPCDDQDGCTVNDHCKFGACIPGASNSCNGSTCFPKWPLYCGGGDAWATTEDGATANVAQYSCSDESYPGPEYTYAFVPPWDGSVSITLESEMTGHALMLLESKGTGCDGTNCRMAGKDKLTFHMFKGRSYFLVVDSQQKDGGEFSIKVDCTPSSEYLCDNEDDEDKDGLIDCDDPDCQSSPACPPPVCQPIWALNCGSKDFGSNYGLGNSNAITSYASITENKGCLDNQWDYSGPEFAYRFDAPGSFNVTVRLTGETSQTDLLILRDEGTGCNPVDCIAWGLKKVTFPAEAGQTYYFVVDGYAGAYGRFDIEVECPSFIETSCFDGDDNDLDTLTDCEDPDCYQAVECVGYCQPAKYVGCGFRDAFANFGWGSTMAVSEYAECTNYIYNGPEIAYRFVAPYDTQVEAKLLLESASTDIVVIEGEQCDPGQCITYGLDSADFQAEAGGIYNIIIDGWQLALGTYLFDLQCIPDTEVDCGDGLDNDADGLTDCHDEADCAAAVECPKCTAVYPLKCGDTDEWNNGGQESTDKLDSYACHTGQYQGPEFAYVFEPATSGTATVTLEDKLAELDILIMGDNGFGCNPANCLAWATNEIEFQVESGNKYYIVVDGYGKTPKVPDADFGSGDYTISLTCQ